MENTHNEIPLIVIDMNHDPEDSWNLFCGYDPKHHRIAFFRDLNMFGLPQLQGVGKSPWITIERNGTIIESGGPYIVGGHGDQYRLAGFNGIRKDIKDTTKLPAYILKPNDKVFIRGVIWGNDNPIDSLATRRKRGMLAWEVFAKYTDDYAIIKEFFASQSNYSPTQNLQMAQVVFENYPGKQYVEFF